MLYKWKIMKVHQIFTGSQLRNFTYIVEGANLHQYIIDPWDAQQCMNFCAQQGGLIKGVINTHEHWDHTQGNEEIVKRTMCAVYAHPSGKGKIKEANCFLHDGDEIEIDEGTKLRAMDTPGHTFAHLCLLLLVDEKVVGVFTGDTLFNAGVGNCHNGGDPAILYETIIHKFKVLPTDVMIYPGHEYLGNNLKFTLDREPSNSDAKDWLKRYGAIDWDQSPVVTTMADELKINTFLRLEKSEIRNLLDEGKGAPATDKETFLKLRERRNHW